MEILTFRKNNEADIKIGLVEQYNKWFIDIRQWRVIRQETFPTKQGVRFAATSIGSLKEAVEAIAKRLEELIAAERTRP